jgi:Sec-independent protein translocase protein TatA
MKKNPENEPLLNVIARKVGRAAGTVARAAKQITGEENTAANPAKTRKKAKPAAATKSAKKKPAKSRTRKSQPTSSSGRAKPAS